MTIEQANAIPMSEFLEKLGFNPVKEKNNSAYYLSPLRKEKTGSFHLNKIKNCWYDFGAGHRSGGDLLQFVQDYLKVQNEDNTIKDSLRYIKNIWEQPASSSIKIPNENALESGLVLKSVKEIESRFLEKYLEDRGIPIHIAKTFLKEVRVYNLNSKKTITSLGMLNEDDGYELRNAVLKGSVNGKDITFIRGTDEHQTALHIFEGMFDYASVLTRNKLTRLKTDIIILNSVSMLRRIYPYIQDYSYKTVYSWFDNDPAGNVATEELGAFLSSKTNIRHMPKNESYRPFKDPNAYHMHFLNL